MVTAIIGGGASGMAAAISAKRTDSSARIIIIEKSDRQGKKLLATGNGRCNYSNINVQTSNYHGKHPEFVNYALNEFNVDYTINFFNNLGVFPREETQGRLYPFSGQASSVLDALRTEIERLGIEVIVNGKIKSAEVKKQGFKITLQDKNIFCDRLIVACGGCASPKLGSDGSGFEILKGFGHKIVPVSPALTQMKTNKDEIKGLSGIRVPVTATLISGDKVIDMRSGEVQFTDYGLSGIVILELSLTYKQNCVVSLDLMAEYPLKNVFDILQGRKQSLSHLTMENFFNGLLNKRIGNSIARRAGIEKLSYKVCDLDRDMLWDMARIIKDFRFNITGLNGFENAQTTLGGADTSLFYAQTMESRLVKGLFCCGEILDIAGDCGGYNLQWAWSSGFLAGRSAVEK